MPALRAAVVPRGAGSTGMPEIKWVAVRQYAGNHKVKEKMRRRDATFRVCFDTWRKVCKGAKSGIL